jgi:hypothetical protein
MQRGVTLVTVFLTVFAASMVPVGAATVTTATPDATAAQPAPSVEAKPEAEVEVEVEVENQSDTGENRSDPTRDVLGWESVNGTGLWYNESVAVTQEDGLNQTELDAVVARGMARVEVVRELEFNDSVPVEVISREELAERRSGRYENLSAEATLHHNIKLEALFFVPEDRNAVAVQQSSDVGGTLGFYVPSQDRITIVSENTTAPRLDEITLSQELFHALQDQRFDEFRELNRSYNAFNVTTERRNTVNSVIEGDGNYVDYLYEQRCDAEWNCLLPNETGGGGGDVHLGLNVMGFQPYSDGPAFVQSVKRRGGWKAVDELYESPPASTEQVIHPERYPEDDPTDVTVTDRSTDRWHTLERTNDSVAIDYVQTSAANETFGEAGLFAMFVYPAYETNGRTQLVSVQNFLNQAPSGDGLDPVDPLNYSAGYTTGWDGDTLVPYVRNDSIETNETGYVWKTVWDTDRDADEFVTGYRKMLDFRGGEPVPAPGEDVAYVVTEGGYEDAFYLERSGATVTIVNAPTLDALPEVRNSVPTVSTTTESTTTRGTTTVEPTATTAPPDTTTAESTVTTNASTTTTTDTDVDADPGTDAQPQPGFGFGTVLVLVVFSAGLLVFRRR